MDVGAKMLEVGLERWWLWRARQNAGYTTAIDGCYVFRCCRRTKPAARFPLTSACGARFLFGFCNARLPLSGIALFFESFVKKTLEIDFSLSWLRNDGKNGWQS